MFTAAARTGRGFVDLAATVVLARLLTPDDYGLIGMVVAVTGFIALFKDLGLAMATVQRERITHGQVSYLFWINLALGVGLAVLTAAAAPGIAWFYGEPRLLAITLVLSSTFVVSGASVQHEALLKRNLLHGRIAVVEVTSMILSASVAVWLSTRGAGVWALVAQTVSLVLLRWIGIWTACDWRPSWNVFGEEGTTELVRFGRNLTGFSVVNYMARNVDDILVGKFFGTQSLGLYQQAYKLLMIPLRQINAPFASVAVPALSRLVEEPDRYRRAYRRMLEKILIVSTPLGAFMISSAPELIEVALGARWVPAADIFRWFGILVFTQPMANSVGWLFVSQDRTGEMFRWGVVGSSLSVASFIAGLGWGAEGVAFAYAASGVVLRTPILLAWVGRRGAVRARDIYAMVFPFVLAAGTGLGGAWLLRAYGPSWPALAWIGVSAAWIALATATTLALHPRGRAALMDVTTSLRQLKPS